MRGGEVRGSVVFCSSICFFSVMFADWHDSVRVGMLLN